MSSSPWQKSIPSELGGLGIESRGFVRGLPAERKFWPEFLDHGVFRPDDWLLLQNTLGLSQRELQIVQSVFDDEKRETIAWRLGISPGTVNTYMQRLYAKLEVRSRAQLIVRVIAAYLFLAAGA